MPLLHGVLAGAIIGILIGGAAGRSHGFHQGIEYHQQQAVEANVAEYDGKTREFRWSKGGRK